MITGKAKEAFEKWYLSLDWLQPAISEFGSESTMRSFLAMHLSFQWGIYLDFFESVGIKISIYLTNSGFAYYTTFKGSNIRPIACKTRQEAQKAAIKAATEILNQNNK